MRNTLVITNEIELLENIKSINSTNSYYIETRIKKFIEIYNKPLSFDIVMSIYDYLDYKMDELNATLKCKSLHNNLTQYLD